MGRVSMPSIFCTIMLKIGKGCVFWVSFCIHYFCGDRNLLMIGSASAIEVAVLSQTDGVSVVCVCVCVLLYTHFDVVCSSSCIK